MKSFVFFAVAVALVIGSAAPKAHALGEFKKAFEEKYVKEGDDGIKASFKEQNCNLCHVKDEKKNVRNAYGKELAKLIEGDANDRLKTAQKEGGADGRKAELEKVMEEVEKAFKELEEMKKENSDTTYGDVIKSGKLEDLAK